MSDFSPTLIYALVGSGFCSLETFQIKFQSSKTHNFNKP